MTAVSYFTMDIKTLSVGAYMTYGIDTGKTVEELDIKIAGVLDRCRHMRKTTDYVRIVRYLDMLIHIRDCISGMSSYPENQLTPEENPPT
jgi:hypothetical protein